MSTTSLELAAGQRVSHVEMGDGVVAAIEPGGYARVFFRAHGERQVSVASLMRELSWEEQVVSEVRPATEDAVKKLWLALEAEQLPLLESAATLTAAKVDLLPHQIVMTYRVANATPRRFLVADSVGLGKTHGAGLQPCVRRHDRRIFARAAPQPWCRPSCAGCSTAG